MDTKDRVKLEGTYKDLLFAQFEVKELREKLTKSELERGFLNSEIAELKQVIKDGQISKTKSRQMSREIRREEMYQSLKHNNKVLGKKVSELRNKNIDLIIQLNKLNEHKRNN